MTMVRTAGMANGTPDWQLDRMYETDTAKKLEEAYKEDDFPKTSVSAALNYAEEHISYADGFLCRAGDIADKYGKADEIDELISRLEDLKCDIYALRQKILGRWTA